MTDLREIRWGPSKNEHDRGIDLFALVRDESGEEMGLIVYVQVKSGRAKEKSEYFKRPEKDADGGVTGWWYYDSNRTRVEAWADHAIPHLLVLHDLKTKVSYWVHVTQEAIVPAIRNGKPGKGVNVLVPATNVIDEDHREALLAVAATFRSKTSWEGSRWAGSDRLDPADLWRYAMIAPRLVAPHPNAHVAAVLTPEQAVALLANGEPDQLDRLLEATPGAPSLEQASASSDWGWRFAGAIDQRVRMKESDALLSVLSEAPDPTTHVASNVAAASALIEDGLSEDAIELLDKALGRQDLAPVDRAWLIGQRARASAEIGRIGDARVDAIEVQSVRVKAPEDATANAIAGSAVALLFNTSWLQPEPVEEPTGGADNAARSVPASVRGLVPAVSLDEPETQHTPIRTVIEAIDTAAGWWRAQTTSFGLNALAENEFKAWSEDLTVTIGAPDTVRNKLTAASLSASYLGDHASWRSQAGLLGQALLLRADRNTDPIAVAEALDLLRRAGEQTELERAVKHIAADGPIEAITLAAAEIRLERSTRTTGPCDLALLEHGGDLLDDETAVRSVEWLLQTITEPGDFDQRTSARYALPFRLIETLAGLAANLNVQGMIVEHLLALPPQDDPLTASAWARVVRALPYDAWDADTARRSAEALDAHDPSLRITLLGVAARFDASAKAMLGKEIKAGSLDALAAFGDVSQLSEQDARIHIGRLAESAERQIQAAEAHHWGLGGHDIGSALVVLNAWHPRVAKWQPLLDLLANAAVAKEHKQNALESLASLTDRIPQEIRERLQSIAVEIAEARPADIAALFGDGRDLAGPASNLAVASGVDPEWADQTLLRLLAGSDYHRYWATLIAARLNRQQDAGILASLAQDPCPDVRAGAAAGLATLANKHDEKSFAAQALERCLDDPGRKVPATIAAVLAATPKRGVVAQRTLDQLQSHRSTYIRNLANRTPD